MNVLLNCSHIIQCSCQLSPVGELACIFRLIIIGLRGDQVRGLGRYRLRDCLSSFRGAVVVPYPFSTAPFGCLYMFLLLTCCMACDCQYLKRTLNMIKWKQSVARATCNSFFLDNDTMEDEAEVQLVNISLHLSQIIGDDMYSFSSNNICSRRAKYLRR